MSVALKQTLLNRIALYLKHEQSKTIDTVDYIDAAGLFACAGLAERYAAQQNKAKLIAEISPILFNSTTATDVDVYLRDASASHIAQISCALGVFPFEKSLLNADYKQNIVKRVAADLKPLLSTRSVQTDRSFPVLIPSADLGFNATLPQAACNRLLNLMLASGASPANPFDEQWQFVQATASQSLPKWVDATAALLPTTPAPAPAAFVSDFNTEVYYATATRGQASCVAFCALLRALCFALHVQNTKSSFPRGLPVQRVLDWGVLNTANARTLLVLCEATPAGTVSTTETSVALVLAYLAELLRVTEVTLSGVFDFSQDVGYVVNNGSRTAQVVLTKQVSSIAALSVHLPVFPVLRLSAFYACGWTHKVYEAFSQRTGPDVLSALARGVGDSKDDAVVALRKYAALKLNTEVWFPAHSVYGSGREQQLALVTVARDILAPLSYTEQSLTAATAVQLVLSFDECATAKNTYAFLESDINTCPVSSLISQALLPREQSDHKHSGLVIDAVYSKRNPEHVARLSKFSANLEAEYKSLGSPRGQPPTETNFVIDQAKFASCLDLIGRGAQVDASHVVKCLTNSVTQTRKNQRQPGTVDTDKRIAVNMLQEAFSAFK